MTETPLYRESDYSRRSSVTIGQGQGHDAAWRPRFWRDRARLLHSPSFRRLQGKTQLFAGLESDFFRNRLTHSLEVAQIAKTITLRLNAEELSNTPYRIDPDLVELAALAHDLGHPPFGHTGEHVLDEVMRHDGGFEGNAQTLRILTKLEKKLDDPERQLASDDAVWYRGGEEASVGLNLCSRSLASILKYDSEIVAQRPPDADVAKGFYGSERDVVEQVRRDVVGDDRRPLRVVECQIMDLADDMAYSTYDVEDAFKAGLLNPLDLLYPADRILDQVAERVERELGAPFGHGEAREVLTDLFSFFASPEDEPAGEDWSSWYLREVGRSYSTALVYARSGFHRTALTSILINQCIQAVHVEVDEAVPALSSVTMDDHVRCRVSVLKHLIYVLLISSQRLKLVEQRGRKVIRSIFEALDTTDGHVLMPDDFVVRYEQAPSDSAKRRVLCDYIAGMTDRYALDFYARLRSEGFQSMFRVL